MAKYEVKDINKNGKIDSWEQAKYDAINKSADSPATMISTAMPGVDPMTGTIQQNQFAPSPVNPRALGSLQNQIPNIAGAAVPGMYDRILPSPLTNNHDDKKIIGENTDKIKVDKEGRQYSLIMENSVNARKGDTIRSKSGYFNPNKIVDGYLMGGDYTGKKTGPKTITLNK